MGMHPPLGSLDASTGGLLADMLVGWIRGAEGCAQRRRESQPTRQPGLIFKSSAPMFLAFGLSCTSSLGNHNRPAPGAYHDIQRTNALTAAPLIHTCEQSRRANCAHAPHAHPNLHEPPWEFFSLTPRATTQKSGRRPSTTSHPSTNSTSSSRARRRKGRSPSSRSLSSEASARKESLERAQPKFRQPS